MTTEAARVGAVGAVIGVILGTAADRYDAMRSFYVETLGMPVRTDRPGHVNFQWGNTRLTIARHDGVSGSSRDPRRVLLNLAVDDIEAVAAGLRSAGVAFLREPSSEPWGGSIATFEDPDGNTLQLMQLPPGGE
ncbi:MAG: VOC family protein [Chloroflexi bacterium]|nr:VOC family protein [Chloroflexota bacterium]